MIKSEREDIEMTIIKSVQKDFQNNGSFSCAVGVHLYHQKEQPICLSITLVEPHEQGQRAYCDCVFEGTTKFRVYDPDLIFWGEAEVEA